ncbi:MAG: NAD(P)/FAD-dependent oxidoreductase [Pseudolabrys sp.]|nr:NAD(P)/FAD-dependent oxidoreductase [Pseudolabrys sp.]MDP2298095.1 NAD(P)/FAD-dependent oxidoreductase [Pseudolabrys sp.]
MTYRETEIAIIGGGAAGIAAGRHLHDAGIACLIVEARSRLGGRAWTCDDASGLPLDLGCGWLHSADRNPWAAIAEAQGRSIDKTSPPWSRPSLPGVFKPGEQNEFNAAMAAFFERMSAAVAKGKDMPAAAMLEPGNRWNNLITAVGTYISGTELKNMSALDFELYDDTEINWRVKEGYGTAITAHGDTVPVMFDSPVTRIDHSGTRVKIVTVKGDIAADKVIITLPTNVLAERADFFAPTLPEKTRAAARLPLGLADKLFLNLDHAEEFEPGGRLFGSTERSRTGTYHMRPFGRPLIECFYAGQCARDLEAGGERAFFNFAVEELTKHLGSGIARRVKPSLMHSWGKDPYARGSYSYAVPGAAYERAMLAGPVDERLFFAGEACSAHDFSTAHGAYLTGVAAAEQAIATLKRRV